MNQNEHNKRAIRKICAGRKQAQFGGRKAIKWILKKAKIKAKVR